MQQFYSRQPHLLVLILLSVFAWVQLSSAQTVTWQALPFPTDSNWPGPFGEAAVITANEVILNGRPARSVQAFSGPLSIQCDVSLAARTNGTGVFTLSLLPLGQPLDKDLASQTAFQMIYRNPGNGSGQDGLLIVQIANKSGTRVWGEVPFTVTAGTFYHISMDVAASGALSLSINGLPYSLPSTTAVPFSQFQLQLGGWMPGDFWHVTNFTAVPEPSTSMLVGASLLGLATVMRRRK